MGEVPKEKVEKAEIEEKTLGLKDMLKQGLGGTIGGPIFVILGIAVFQAKGGLLISIFLNGLLMMMFVMIFSELALSLPIAGGGYSFSKEAIGGAYGFLIGWMMWVGNMLFAALSARGFALSFEVFVPSRFVSNNSISIIGTVITLFFFLINYRYPDFLSTLMKVSTYLLVLGFIVFIVLGLTVGPTTNAENFGTGLIQQSASLGEILSTTAFTFIIFCIYEWNSTFENLTAEFDKIKQPRKTLPRGFIISIGIGVIIYWFATLTTLLNIGDQGNSIYETIVSSDAPLADVFGYVLGPFGTYFMGFIGMVATITSINAGMQMATHLLHSMARDGFTHPVFKRKRGTTEYVALITSSIMVILFVIFSGEEFLTQVTNFVFLISMAFLSLSVIALRNTRPNLIRPWKVPGYPYLPLIGIVASIILVFTIDTWAVLTGVAVLIIGIVYYLIKIARRDRQLLLIYGIKIAAIVFLVVFSSVFQITNSTQTLSLNIFFGILALLVLLTLPFDYVSIRQLLLRFTNKTDDTVIVGTITQLDKEKSDFAKYFNYVVGFLLLSIGIIVGICDILILENIIQVSINTTNEIVSLDPSFLHYIGIIILTAASIGIGGSGIAVILQEIERKELNPDNK